MPPHPTHDPLASSVSDFGSTSTTTPASGSHLQRSSVGTSRSGGALTFPPLYLDPVDPHNPSDPASSNPHGSNPAAQQPGSFVLGSTFYHHPQLNALVSNHLIDASANAVDGASGNAFLSSIFANRDGGAHEDDSDADDAAGGGGAGGGVGGADAAVAVPRPKITSEFVSLNEDLVPASLDMHGDMLPADQHPSYPFGNLFGPLGGVIAADSAIVGGMQSASAAASLGAGLGDAAATLGMDFGGGLDGFINLGQSSHGRRSAVSNAWNSFINKASRSKLVGSAGAPTDYHMEAHQNSTASAARHDHTGPSQVETIKSAKKLDLSPSLLFRTNTSTVLAPPTWPFRRHGPGCTSYAALLRPSSNIFGTSPASQAVAATLGGLPSSSKILREVWSDLALEQLVPTRIGETSAVRHLDADAEDGEAETDVPGSEKRGKKRARTDPDTDAVFAKRMATIEADPLDLLGPISREIRGQAGQVWGSATRHLDKRRRRRRRRSYSDQSDLSAEAEHDDPEQGFSQRDRLRYSFALLPAQYSWTESADEDEGEQGEQAERLHVEPDGIGWSTAKSLFVKEERDRMLPEVASRATSGGGIEAYQVRGLRANQGLLPRPGWTWRDGPVQDDDDDGAGNMSILTEMTASSSHQTDLTSAQDHAQEAEQAIVGTSEEEADYDEEEDEEQDEATWEQEGEGEDSELQRALLMQYQQQMADDAAEADRASQQQPSFSDDEEEVEDDVIDVAQDDQEAQVEYDHDAHYADEDLEQDEDVESFDEG